MSVLLFLHAVLLCLYPIITCFSTKSRSWIYYKLAQNKDISYYISSSFLSDLNLEKYVGKAQILSNYVF
jgi:hypothetical protein